MYSNIGHRHPRIHQATALDNVNRERALKGICGQCINLTIKVKRVDGKDKIALMCKQGRSPLSLYRDTALGETANCASFSQQTA